MVAIYPTAVKSFSYRQDFTEIVEAADVNVAYDEIGAVQTVLGTYPNTDNIDGVTQTWPTVKASIQASKRGVTKPICYVHAVNNMVPYSFNNAEHGPSGINATFSYATWDTHGMWQGGSVLKCPRTGWYDFAVYTEWQLESEPFDFEQPPFERSGYVQLGLQVDGGGRYVTGYNFPVLQGQQFAPRESASQGFPWFKDSPLTVSLTQNVRASGPLPCNVYLSVTYVRDAPTQNNL